VVVEHADIGGEQDPQPAIVDVHRDVGGVLRCPEVAELALEEGPRSTEVVPLADLHGSTSNARMAASTFGTMAPATWGADCTERDLVRGWPIGNGCEPTGSIGGGR